MHERAFEMFGGIPKKCLYDNLKSVVLHHVGSVVQFNPNFLVFAGHHLFEPTAAPVRYPQAKGRVEGRDQVRAPLLLLRTHVPGPRRPARAGATLVPRNREPTHPRNHA
jgi:transposase